jgi:hypothetical protein
MSSFSASRTYESASPYHAQSEIHHMLESRKTRPINTNMIVYDGDGIMCNTGGNSAVARKCMNTMAQNIKKEKIKERLQKKLALKTIANE